MTATFPVHPDDVAMLMELRRYLVGFRVCNGWSQEKLSMMINGTKGGVYDLEHSDRWAWRLSRLQGWVSVFDLKLEANLRFDHDYGLEQRVEEHPEVAPLLGLTVTSTAWQKWQRMALTSALVVARKEQGINTQVLADKLGITRGAVQGWEANSDEILLSKLMHHARVLGGRMDLRLREHGNR